MTYVTTRAMKKWFLCKCGNGYMYTKTRSSGFRRCWEVCYPGKVNYKKEVRALGFAYRMSVPFIEKVIDHNGKMPPEWDVDHIVPIWFGEAMGIDIFEIAGIVNMQVISSADNSICTKYGKGSLLPEKWFSLITGKKWVYSVSGSYFESYSLFEACEYARISYVKAASQLMKQAAEIIVVGSVMITRG